MMNVFLVITEDYDADNKRFKTIKDSGKIHSSLAGTFF